MMSDQAPPLVSIVIPMYNNAEYVEQCIESVRSQTYERWECVIVNNCSTDGSAEIARRLCAADPRFRVLDNQEFLNPAELNHNHALRQISPASKYCKMVFSDDWLFPRCVQEMVAVAETHPSAAIVSAYGLQGAEPTVKWAGLPYPSPCVSGREVCRLYLLKGIDVFGSAHCVLYRSDVVRKRDPFFNETNIHADLEVCFDILQDSDFGYVHQVLTFTRERSGSLSDVSQRFNTFLGGKLHAVVRYGPNFLKPEEYRERRSEIIDEYYNYLAINLALGRRNPEFWKFHKKTFALAELEFSYPRLGAALLARCFTALTHPQETFRKLRGIGSRKLYDRG